MIEKIKCWYGPGGALITNQPIPNITNVKPMGKTEAAYYGGEYFICESMQKAAAPIIAQALGLQYEGEVSIEVMR